MSEVTEATEVEENPTIDEESAGMAEAFDSDAPAVSDSVAAEPESTGDHEPQPDPEPVVEPEPDTKVLTRAEYEDLVGKASKVDKIFGKLGSLEDQLRRVQAQSSTPIEVGDVFDKEFAETYPDIVSGISEALKKIPAVGAKAPAIDPDAVIDLATKKAQITIAEETLDATHEGWRQVIGMDFDEQGRPPQTEYRQWLATQPASYQDRVNNAFSPVVIGKSIDDFREAKKKAQAAADARQRRIAAAVTPKGTGGHSVSAPQDDEDAGFRSAFS